jgi:Tol biopolymer transport system component/DNA-binding winged helix-turn-helix (wHTH) protein
MVKDQWKPRAFRFGVFELDLESQELRKHGIRIKLTAQPLQVLGMLVQRQGEVLSREELRCRLWPDQPFGDHDHSLNKAVNRIREALGDSSGTPRYLETIPRIGYRFLFPAEPLDVRSKEAQPASAALELPQQPSRRRAWLWVLFAALLLAVGLLIGIVSRPAKQPSGSRSTLVPVPITGYAGAESWPSFSPSGNEVTFSWDGESPGSEGIYISEIGSGRRLKVAGGPFVQTSPAWSPNGRQIVFLRESSGGSKDVMVVNADGTDQHILGSTRVRSQLAWAQDSNLLVVTDRDPSNRTSVLYVLSSKDFNRRQLTFPLSLSGDSTPAFSPDGRLLAFARYTSPEWNDIFVLEVTAEVKPIGAPQRVTNFHRHIEGIAWTSDSHELVFSAGGAPAGHQFLYRVPVSGSAEPRDLAAVRLDGTHPAVSAGGKRLVYVRPSMDQTTVWQLRLTADGRSVSPPSRLIVSAGRDFNADISPDGRRVVFRSDRSGSPELWVSDSNGSNLHQITKFGENGATAPRWSPDGQSVVMECRVDGQSEIYSVNPDTDALRRITHDLAPDILPSWSRDGRFIYFSSTRTGRAQIWKVPRDGGVPIQVTRRGGLYAVESVDGRYLFYTDDGTPATLRRMPISGREETDIVRNLIGLSSFAVAENGICYLAAHEPSHPTSLCFYEFATRKERLLLTLNKPVHHGLSMSRDGRTLLFAQEERRESDLMLLENF